MRFVLASFVLLALLYGCALKTDNREWNPITTTTTNFSDGELNCSKYFGINHNVKNKLGYQCGGIVTVANWSVVPDGANFTSCSGRKGSKIGENIEFVYFDNAFTIQRYQLIRAADGTILGDETEVIAIDQIVMKPIATKSVMSSYYSIVSIKCHRIKIVDVRAPW